MIFMEEKLTETGSYIISRVCWLYLQRKIDDTVFHTNLGLDL